MGQTKIEWTATYHPDGTVTPGYTFNPWIGCQKTSPGCQNCYAERDFTRKPRWANTWGPPETSERLRTSEANWKKPLAWNKRAQKEGIRYKVFCASLADVFEDNDSLIDWRLDLFELIRDTPNLDWLVPTKRPEIAHQFFKLRPDLLFPNIIPGTSIENQKTADARVPWLLQIPAAVRFVSAEPLLDEIKLRPSWLSSKMKILNRHTFEIVPNNRINWCIVGGESGPHARPMHPDWARSLRNQCQAAGVPFFFKQWGMFIHASQMIPGVHYSESEPQPEGDHFLKCKNKHVAGRLLDGREWNQMPEVA